MIIRRIKSGGAGSQIAIYQQVKHNSSTTASKVSRNKKVENASTPLDYHDMRNNALTRLKTQGASEILKHNFEEGQMLNGN